MKLSTAWTRAINSAYRNPNIFLTMNFNRNIGTERMAAYAKRFFALTERELLGRNYYKMREGRIDCLGVIESPYTNPHIHWYGQCPQQVLKDDAAHYSELFTETFKKVVPSGTIDLRIIWNKRRLGGYLSKQLYLPDRGDRILFTRDFWPPGSELED